MILDPGSPSQSFSSSCSDFITWAKIPWPDEDFACRPRNLWLQYLVQLEGPQLIISKLKSSSSKTNWVSAKAIQLVFWYSTLVLSAGQLPSWRLVSEGCQTRVLAFPGRAKAGLDPAMYKDPF